jgi:hypothetical protein
LRYKHVHVGLLVLYQVTHVLRASSISSLSLSLSSSKGKVKVAVPNMRAHLSELKLGSSSDEAAIVANQSSKTTLNWGVMAPVKRFKMMGIVVA